MTYSLTYRNATLVATMLPDRHIIFFNELKLKNQQIEKQPMNLQTQWNFNMFIILVFTNLKLLLNNKENADKIQ